MTIRVALNHVTHYRYDDAVQLSPQVVRLRPAAHCRTPVLSYSLKATPAQQFINWQQDPQGNFLARFVFPEPTRELRIEVDLVADMTIINPFDFFVEPAGEFWPLKYEPALERELKPYLETLPLTPEFEKYFATIPRVKRNSVDFVVDINRDLGKHIGYLIRLEPGVQSPEETLAKRSGSCRDSAWLLVQILRRLGLAARFASGYLIQLTADVKALDGPSGTEKDFTDLHAWTEVYLPGAGWIGFDPTSGLLAGEGHIPLACSPDPQSAAPISGGFAVLGGAEETETSLDFRMTVTRIHEDPRVTKPYTEEQWAGIEALGLKVDADLAAHDVRLTMGGEPTFVSIDDMDGAEWTTAALGTNKRLLAGELTHRLRERFADGALLHIGQGKWYPGEPLPRWALGLYWRKDGVPIWTRPELFADERKPAGHTDKDSGTFITALSERLGAGAKWLMPAYEDTWYYLWKEGKLPSNVDPLASRLDNEQDRQRFAKVFGQGLDKVVGHVLPLGRVRGGSGPGWVSGPWFLRQEHLYLMPGDSPIGLRLPLDSLPWASAEDLVGEQPLDPLALRPPLPAREQLRPPQ
ncbi:MAG: transglutaminase family protein, partial [Planctomycetes bacterium]|nr:transglutaminase family protein [Planctomycetota bacterium]